MGIRLQVDLETNRGPTNELFIRIDHFKINRTVAKIVFTTTLWLNKELADNSLKKLADDPIQPSKGLVNPKVIYYDGPESEGVNATFQELYNVSLAIDEKVEKDIFESRKVKKEIPYVSFDENGDEITLYRTKEVEEKYKVGTETKDVKIIDYSILNRLEEFCYNHVVKTLSGVIPKDKIEKLY
jgi:hypothetical protein